MLEHSPSETPTMTGLAKHLGISPMGLYTYVANHKDLLAGLSDIILSRLQLHIDPQACWEDQLRSWLDGVYQHMRAYPYSLKLIDSESTVGSRWLAIEAALVRILMRADLVGEQLAYTTRWVAQTPAATIMLNPAMKDSKSDTVEYKSMTRAMDGLGPGDAESLWEILPHIGRQDLDSTFSFYSARVVEGVKALALDRSDF